MHSHKQLCSEATMESDGSAPTAANDEGANPTEAARLPGYEMPDMDRLNNLLERLRAAPREELLAAFFKRRAAPRRPDAVERYPASREANLALNLALNEKRLIAPAFRDFLKTSHGTGFSEAESTLSMDNQVIDLHYLHCHYRSQVKPSNSIY